MYLLNNHIAIHRNRRRLQEDVIHLVRWMEKLRWWSWNIWKDYTRVNLRRQSSEFTQNWTELDFLGKCQQVWEKFFSWFILLLIFSFSSLIKTLELLFGILQFKFMWFLYICFFFLLWIVYLLLYWERYRSRAKWVHLRFLGRALPNALFNKTWWFTASIKGFDAKERIMS